MPDKIVVSVAEVYKKYNLYESPRDRIKEALHPFRRRYHKDFWALNGVSFDVNSGETIGIIGRNGSGKSTLLQIISGVLQPTKGEVTVKGRVSALLELGAGFNPAFTGRENVILNGIVMGISRENTLKLLPGIEAYADIGEYFNQPVKTYSSGMFVRLAFAFAISIDPDILIIDEALAVGDINFQFKCYATIAQMQREGKTIIFVSHDANAIIRHAHRAVVLNENKLFLVSEPREAVNKYLELISKSAVDSTIVFTGGSAKVSIKTIKDAASGGAEGDFYDGNIGDRCPWRPNYNSNEIRHGERSLEIIDYCLRTSNNDSQPIVESGGKLDIFVKIIAHAPIERPVFGYAITSTDGFTIHGENTKLLNIVVPPLKKGSVHIVRWSITITLNQGIYFIDLGVGMDLPTGLLPVDRRAGITHFNVVSRKVYTGVCDLDSFFDYKLLDRTADD